MNAREKSVAMMEVATGLDPAVRDALRARFGEDGGNIGYMLVLVGVVEHADATSPVAHATNLQHEDGAAKLMRLAADLLDAKSLSVH